MYKRNLTFRPREERGFVLILVLVLLALVTILVVASSIMARIERRASWNTARVEQARQNALFALSVAVGQLQRAAGPDQRVTARADILSSGTAAGLPAIVQPYWTGVWQTYDNTAASSGTGFQYLDGQTGGIAGNAMGTGTTGYNIRQFSTIGSGTGTTPLVTCTNMVWLVSGGTNNTTINPSAASTSWTSNSVLLAKNLNAASAYSGSTGALSVTVPLVPIMGTTVGGTTNASGTSGKYGYWVSDEGVKARVNLSDPTYGVTPQMSGSTVSNFVQNQQHFLTPQANPIQTALLLGGSNTQDLRSTSVVLPSDFNKVTTLQSMGLTGSGNALVGMSGTGASFFSPDATTYSRGVLADVRNGGLKIDLSQVFEDKNQLSAFITSFSSSSSPMLRLWQPVQPSWVSGDASVWSIITPSFDAGNDMTPAEFGPRWQALYNYYCMYKNAIPYSVENTAAAPWGNINQYSSGTPGTPTPTVDQRVFDYTSNYNGSSGSSSSELGEYYLPHILGFAVTFFMQAVPGAPAGSGTSYQLIVYAVPQLVLYNPYNVVLQAHGGTPYTVNLYSNILGQTWSIQVVGAAADAQTVESKKPISWGGVVVNGTNTVPELTFVTGTGNYVFQPGEIKVVGAQTQADKQAASGKLVVFDGQGGDQLIGGTPGFSQYQYVYADSSTSGNLLWTGTLTSPASDQIVVSATFGGTQPNDGEYFLASNPGSWPGTAAVNTHLGRFFNRSPAITSGTSVSMYVTAISSSTVPNRSIAGQFCQFLLRAKGMQQVNSSTSSVTYSYGAPIFAGCDGALNPMPLYFDDTMQDIFFGLNQNSVSTTEIQGGSAPPYDSYWGTQDVGLNPADPSFVVLHDLPRQPMISLGQFMHMAMRNSMSPDSGQIDTNSSLWPVGGSLADPFFALNLTNNNNNTPSNGIKPFPTTPTQGGGSPAYFDENFLNNQALFDTYYFSTVPPPSSDMDASYTAVMPSSLVSGSNALTTANIQNGTVAFPNARMRVYRKNGMAPLVSSAFMASGTAFPNYQSDSANLMMDGAFNVNSTSVQAWASLLSSLSGTGNAVNYLSTTGTFSTLSSVALQNPIFRLLSPVLSHSATVSPSEINTSGSSSPWGCINALSNSQVLALATSIVNQVKQRGPFLSMADFLNRRLDPPCYNNGTIGPSTGLGLKGALQAAIDNTFALTGTDLNNTQLMSYGMTTGTSISGSRGSSPSTASNTLASGTTVLQAELYQTQSFPRGCTAEGAPGWLMQQDLVQCFSPVMAVRSDTFVVRCYGEADNQVTGNTEGRAWCEAVVQRLPDYIDQTDAALTSGNAYTTSSLGDATPPYDRVTPVANAGSTYASAAPVPIVDTANQVFGRRFKVISFRWLNESDL